MLFRTEVADGKRQRSLGVVRIVAPVSHRLAAASALLIAFALMAWLTLGTYTRRVHVTGRLVPQAGLIEVTARTPGVVTKVLVAEGQHLAQGDPVATLSAERPSEALGNTTSHVIDLLKADRARLEADIASARALNAEQAAALAKQQGVVQGQLAQIDAQINLQSDQVRIQQQMLDKIEPLRANGYVSAFQVQQQQSQLLSAQAEEKGLLRQRADAVNQLNTATSQLRQLPDQLAARLSELGAQQSTNDQSIAQAEAERSTVLRATQAGTVGSVLVKSGQPVAAEQVIATVVPEASPLVAELLAKSAAVGFIKPGTRVSIHLQSFPYQKFGVQHGQVVSVSRSALSPSEAMVILGQPQVEQEPLYRVDVALELQDIEAYGTREPLRAGMTIDADVLLDRRRIVEWLFEPLIGVRQRYQDKQT